MWPILGGLITGGASLLGNMFSANTSAANTQAQIAAQGAMLNQTENFNAQQAQLSRDFTSEQVGQAEQFSANQASLQRGFEQQMSNTAYQRARNDMVKAGLNPMMMFGSGSMSSTPSVGAPTGQVGASATASAGTPGVPMPQTQSPFAALGDIAAKAVNSAISVKSFEKMTDEIANLRADAAKKAAETTTEWQRPGLIDAQKLATDVARRINEERSPVAQLEGATAKNVLGMPQWVRETMDDANWVGQKASGILAPILNSATKLNQLGVWE